MKRLSAFFARRYLFSEKSHSVINIIAVISCFAVGVPVAAMVILLSVFNGFEGLVKKMYREFDPDLAVYAVSGKVFGADTVDVLSISRVRGVDAVSVVLEDNALLEYRDRQFIGTVRGVDSSYHNVVPIESMVTSGEFRPLLGDMKQALVGEGIGYSLGVSTAFPDPIRVFVPQRNPFNLLLPMAGYREGRLYPSGFFALDAETDGKYIIAPIEFNRDLMGYPDGASAVMVRVADGFSPVKVGEEIMRLLGQDFKVLTRYQQKASIYRIMTYEKWGIFTIIFMVMIIASFSIIGSLVMLIIEKRSDLWTLSTMGATVKFKRGIFLRIGMMISAIGAGGGLILGLALCIVQQRFGIITIPAETFLIDAYPVIIKAGDIAAVVVSIAAVSWLIAKFTAVKMISKYL